MEFLIFSPTDRTRLGLDYYELAVVAGSCILLNYVAADMRTNWIEVRPIQFFEIDNGVLT